MAKIARGNPGLQDLIGSKIILSEAVAIEEAERVLQEMQNWLTCGSLPSDGEVRAFLENLAVDALIELAGPSGEALLRALTLFSMSVPIPIVDKLALHFGASTRHGPILG